MFYKIVKLEIYILGCWNKIIEISVILLNYEEIFVKLSYLIGCDLHEKTMKSRI
jgi:hypothetical protein